MATDTRERILETTAEMFRRYGYTGSGLKQIVADAHAPFGSLYHFFPGGKEQLGEEVIRRSGRMYMELVEAIFDAAPDPVTGTGDVFSGAAEVLRQTEYADACPIATVALEVASSNETLRMATADVFDSWIESATLRFTVAAPNTEGTYHYSLAAGAFTDLQGQASNAYAASFLIDHTGPRIVAQTPRRVEVAEPCARRAPVRAARGRRNTAARERRRVGRDSE